LRIGALTGEELRSNARMTEPADLQLLFHRLNNQLGIILAHAELLESKAVDDTQRSRASQIVRGVLEAMRTTKEIRSLQNRSSDSNL
jgi:hypothetical protein